MTAAARAGHVRLNLNLIGAGAHTGAWRRPGVDPSTFASADSYVAAAREAERGHLDAVFLADTPALRRGIERHPQLQGIDPVVLATAVAVATRRIGLVATLSTTLGDPYDVARRIQSLDVVSRGRAAWNVVVTGTAAAAANAAHRPFGSREERYARAEEFVDVVVALWESWRADAVLADQATGRYARPGGVRAIGHRGRYFQVEGPGTLPRSPQGRPVLVQAGGSPAGTRLAGRIADVVFSSATTVATGAAARDDVRAAAVAAGRDPDAVAVLPGIITVLGGTEAEARRRHRELEDLADHDDALERLAFGLGVARSSLALDAPVDPATVRADAPPAPGNGEVASDGNRRALLALAAQGLTVREILARAGTGGHRVFVGTGDQLADDIVRWCRSGAADGFNLMPDVVLDGTTAIVDETVPVLRRAGLFRAEYEGTTLRDHLGIVDPPAVPPSHPTEGLLP